MSAVQIRVRFEDLPYVDAVRTARELWPGRWSTAAIYAAMALDLNVASLPEALDRLDSALRECAPAFPARLPAQ